MSYKSTSSRGVGSSRVRFRPFDTQNSTAYSNASASSSSTTVTTALAGPHQIPPVVSSQGQRAQAAAPVLSGTQVHFQTPSSFVVNQELRAQRQRELETLRVQLADLQQQVQNYSQSEWEPIEGQVSAVSLGTQTTPILQPHRPIILPVGKVNQGNCTKICKVVPPIKKQPGGLIPIDPQWQAVRPGLSRGGRGRGVLALFGPPPPGPGFGQAVLNRPPMFGGGQARLIIPPVAQLQAAAAVPSPPAVRGSPPHFQFSDTDSDTDFDI